MKTFYHTAETEKILKSQWSNRFGNYYLIGWLIVLVTVLFMSCSATHDKLIDKRFKKHASNKTFKAYYSIQMR